MSASFSERVIAWHKQFGRKDLPWQQNKTLYRVWVSEIMLQQTQVSTVIPYFERFMQQYPDLHSLALANEDDVLNLWTGLGYYARARNLLKAAQVMIEQFNGFPNDFDQVLALPGIGRSTAGAVLSLTEGQPIPILDGNVKRVLARHHMIEGWSGNKKVLDKLWEVTEAVTPKKETDVFNQAMMDIGATICKRGKPLCDECPVHATCFAKANNLQSKLPTPKPKKVIPEKQTCMLICQFNDRILLYKRPSVGIWGGLYAFPEVDGIQDIDPWCEEHGLAVIEKTAMQTFRHTFSHFHLDIAPYKIELEKMPTTVNDRQDIWFDLNEPRTFGISAPTEKLLSII
ncbi:A/G-specific adenine glycosylase [Algibacillus agarilyticus]|uniref:A/G-specific adenine glycosylase n=1 Tax=Algibacillus agarilyticus TaxID=2234133 RepID=UPI000DD06110|nr:A/G-specific adenine glycosylase [Algibacillus agarilyticus]